MPSLDNVVLIDFCKTRLVATGGVPGRAKVGEVVLVWIRVYTCVWTCTFTERVPFLVEFFDWNH